METLIGLRFVINDTSIGLVCLREKITPHAYTEEDQELLLTLVNNFLVLLENARSFSTIKKLNTINLELKADGRGSWAIEENDVSFRWEIKKDTIWIHTKSGGVITGTISGDTIVIILPGIETQRFQRVDQ